MKVLVINGSPKGKKSISLQTIRFLELKYPEDSFEFLHAGWQIRALERDMSAAVAQIQAADLIVFSYPVYTFMAPAQLHRFISLLKEQGCDFSGKYATQFSTSKHFYDVTAHKYVEENCLDLGFTVLPGLSADMEDLPKQEGQKQAVDFWAHTRWLIEGQSLPEIDPDKYTVTLLSDASEEDTELLQLMDEFQNTFPGQIRLLNLHDFPFQGGCLGCLKCAASGKCIYTDHFDVYLREQVQSTDALIYAFTIRDHSMGPLFKMYDDRQFCNGHRTVMMGHPVGYLVAGDYDSEANLQTVLQARAQVGGNYLAGVAAVCHEASDDTGNCSQNPTGSTAGFSNISEASTEAALSDAGNHSVSELCDELIFALEHTYQPPKNFYGVGGMRIFRDLIYQMQGLMKLDHKFFKAHGQYDFPQKKRGTIIAMYLVGALFGNEKLMKKMGGKIDEGMLAPYDKVLKEAERTRCE